MASEMVGEILCSCHRVKVESRAGPRGNIISGFNSLKLVDLARFLT